jgi:hypothetical protein
MTLGFNEVEHIDDMTWAGPTRIFIVFQNRKRLLKLESWYNDTPWFIRLFDFFRP